MEADRSPLVRAGIVVSTLALAAVLVLGFKNPDELAAAAAADGSKSGAAVFRPGGTSGSTSTGTSGAGTAGSGASGVGASGSGTTGSGTSGTSGGGTGGTGGSQTVTGPVENTRYGPVEVQVTVAKGAIVDIQAVELPSGGRSGAISRYVAPILRDQALSAKSASIDGVSGATYTSSAYAASLQAALDQAGV
jgi:hypothetical protein